MFLRHSHKFRIKGLLYLAGTLHAEKYLSRMFSKFLVKYSLFNL